MKLALSPPMRPWTFLIVVCLLMQILLWCTSCVAWNKTSGIAFGTDATKLNHRFDESMTIDDMDNSTAFVKAADEGGDVIDNWFMKQIAMGWLGNERAATKGANALAGKEIDAGVETSAQQVDLEKTKLFLEAAE